MRVDTRHPYRRMTKQYNGAGEKAESAYQQKKLLVLLRSARIDAGLTQAQLAARLNQDQTFVSKYESAERRLDILELREVCQAIGIDFVAFVGRFDHELKVGMTQKSLSPLLASTPAALINRERISNGVGR